MPEWRLFIPLAEEVDRIELGDRFEGYTKAQEEFFVESGYPRERFSDEGDYVESREDTYVVGKSYFGLKARAGKKIEIKIRSALHKNGSEAWVKYKLGKYPVRGATSFMSRCV